MGGKSEIMVTALWRVQDGGSNSTSYSRGMSLCFWGKTSLHTMEEFNRLYTFLLCFKFLNSMEAYAGKAGAQWLIAEWLQYVPNPLKLQILVLGQSVFVNCNSNK